jgi:dTDP-4-dehydrorhamnose reductase
MSGSLLVVGASGLVGSELATRARSRGWKVEGAARRVQRQATRALDLGDRDQLERALVEVNPAALAICSAWPHVDGCEIDPARSERENVGTVRNAVEATRGSAVRLIYFSTDHVFDGARAGAYLESDQVRPPSVYARHKRAAEELLLERGGALICRTSYVFGVEAQRKSFVYRVVDAHRTGEPLKVPERQGGCPTWSRWLADSTLSLLEEGINGVVHLTSGRFLSKADWARLIAARLGLTVELRELPWKEAGQVAPRPERVVLASERHTLSHPVLEEVLENERSGIISS